MPLDASPIGSNQNRPLCAPAAIRMRMCRLPHRIRGEVSRHRSSSRVETSARALFPSPEKSTSIASPPKPTTSPPEVRQISRSGASRSRNTSESHSAPSLPARASCSVSGVNPETSSMTRVPSSVSAHPDAACRRPSAVFRASGTYEATIAVRSLLMVSCPARMSSATWIRQAEQVPGVPTHAIAPADANRSHTRVHTGMHRQHRS